VICTEEVQVAAFLLGTLLGIKKKGTVYMINISQELGLIIFVGGLAGFFLFVVLSSKKEIDTDKKNSSDKK